MQATGDIRYGLGQVVLGDNRRKLRRPGVGYPQGTSSRVVQVGAISMRECGAGAQQPLENSRRNGIEKHGHAPIDDGEANTALAHVMQERCLLE